MDAVFVGLDVSQEATAICIVGEKGELLIEASAPTNAKAIAATLRPYRRAIALVGHEAGSLSAWLHQGLVKLGYSAVCLDARKTREAMASQRNKTDRNDARAIAVLLARGFRERSWPIAEPHRSHEPPGPQRL